MFNKFKSLFAKKPIILCIHGFGRRKSTEYNNFKLWGEKYYDFIVFDIFDDQDENDTNARVWIDRCEKELEKLLLLDREVNIVGFSMGGVIATHLASKYPINKLFLISPAFEFLSVKSIYNTILSFVNNKPSSTPTLSKAHVSCFMEVVDLCKNDIHFVQCPVLLIHGDKDEVIPLRSSINAFDKIPHEKKRLLIIHNGHHRLMLNCDTNNEVYQFFNLFMQNKLITYNPQQAEDPYKKEESQ